MGGPFIWGPTGPKNLNSPSAGAVQSDASGNITAGVLPVSSGGTGSNAVVTTPTANTIAAWDSSKNLSGNNFVPAFTTTATAAGTTTLTIASTMTQVFTGSTTQTVVLPTTSIVAGGQYRIINLSTGSVTVQSSGLNTISTLTANTQGVFTALVATPTTAANWTATVSALGTVPVTLGGTGVTSVTTTATASAFAGWDANKNLSANNFIEGYTTTATAAGTTTLTVASTYLQFFTGTTTQTVVLPVTSTLVLGHQYLITNASTGNVTVQSSGANNIQVMAPNTQMQVTCILTTGTTAASWSATYYSLGVNPISLGGTNNGSLDVTAGGAVYTDGTKLMGTGAGASGQYLKSNGSSAPTWQSLPVVNYIANGYADNGTTGWATYADAAGTSPVDGTGGTATVTIAASATSPLVGSNSFILTKTAANLQGNGWSYDFTIDAGYKAKVLQISANYLIQSGTFVAGSGPSSPSDVTVWIYDVTNAVLIQPSSISFLSNSSTISDQFNATFQTSSNSTSYRLIFHVGSTSTSAYTIQMDQVIVSPSTYVYGTPITDIRDSGTITIAATTTNPTKGATSNDLVRYGRIGDRGVFRYEYKQSTAGSGGTGDYLFSLPAGLSFDSNKVSFYTTVVGATDFPTQIGLGSATAHDGSFAGIGVVIPYDSTRFRIGLVANNGSILVRGCVGTTNLGLSNASASYTADFEAPILGWSSSVQTSDQTDTRVVVFSGNKSSNQAVTAFTTNIIYTSLKDTHGAWNGTDTYTVPVAGDYIISMTSSASGGTEIIAYVNGTTTSRMVGTANSANWLGASNIVYNLKVGDLLTFRPTSSVTITGSAGQNNISISRISGPSAIAASEKITAKYYVSAGASTASTSPINFDTKVWDSHSAVTTGVGAWKFTAPISGEYKLTARNYFGTNSAETYLYKNGSSVNENVGGSIANVMGITGSTNIKLLAGEYIDIRPNTTVTPTSDGAGVSGTNYIIIERVGNY